MLKKYRPITPGTRQLVLPTHENLTRGRGKARYCQATANHSSCQKDARTGATTTAILLCRHKGGGHKQHYRIIDFKRDKENIPARVASIEYDPNRSAYIALLNYADGEKRYIIAPQGLKVGDRVQTSDEPPFHVGCCMKLKFMPLVL